VDTELWIRFSYPFFKAARIKTPTLFLGGQDDFNVPILGGEQMYQALKTLNVSDSARRVPGTEPRADDDQLPARPLRAVPRLVREVLEGSGRPDVESLKPSGGPAS
jgi:hypothetical protein